MSIRDATAADLDEVCTLIEELAAYEHLGDEVVFDREAMGRHLFGPDPPARILLAESDGGEVVGMALYFPTFSTFLGQPGIWLEDLFVRARHRRSGYGTALLVELRRRTGGRLEWAVLDWNRAAVEFYRHLGARPVEGWTRYRWTPAAATPAPDLR